MLILVNTVVNVLFLPMSPALLYITLLDVNDNPPEWVPSDVFSASISEIASAGDEVKQVTAIDRDMNTGAIK